MSDVPYLPPCRCVSASCSFSRDGGLFIKTWNQVYRDRRGKAWKLVSLHQDDSVSKVVEIWARYLDGDVPVAAAGEVVSATAVVATGMSTVT